ncbi:MAG TPA: hypothetical protein VK968_19170, partial [Roseimicrobium sp.]|nr:hypothetical protein [Roseimicrobium sp.]
RMTAPPILRAIAGLFFNGPLIDATCRRRLTRFSPYFRTLHEKNNPIRWRSFVRVGFAARGVIRGQPDYSNDVHRRSGPNGP